MFNLLLKKYNIQQLASSIYGEEGFKTYGSDNKIHSV
jgi:hypothetical protein